MKKITFPNYEAMVEAREKLEKAGEDAISHVDNQAGEYWLEVKK